MPTLAEAIGGKQRVIGGPFGSKLTQLDYSTTGVPVIRGSNMPAAGRRMRGPYVYVSNEKFDRDLSSNAALPGDIIVTQRGTLGQVGILDPSEVQKTFVVSQSQMAIRVDERRAHRDFVYYFLISPQFNDYIANTTIQTGVPHINLGLLRDAPVDWPELNDQIEIASVLSVLDDKIELNRRMNETLEATARAIFKDWFVDFGPTRAKMEGRGPYLAPGIWALFPDGLDDEGKPEGWRTEPLLDHARLISGGTPKTEEPAYWNGAIAWASAKDVSQCADAFLINTERTITERSLSESATRIIPKLATVVVARGATTGRFCMFGREMAMNQTCYALTAAHGRAFWLNCAFGSLVVALVHAAHGSVFDTITTKTIESARTTIANHALLDCFEATASPLFSRMLANIQESGTLAATRDLILPKLISGEIRVKDAEKTAKVVA